MSSRNWGIVTVIAASALVAAPASARGAAAVGQSVSVMTAASTLAPNRFVWADNGSSDPVWIVVNIAEQRAYVYRGEAMIAATSVSTGRAGKDTPSGNFTILQKNVAHRSSLYNNAPMPYMQRLTWDGIAIHAGRNPGRPASHGCIRVPLAFARQLYGVTTMGTQVTVIGEDGQIDATPAAAAPDAEANETADANRAALAAAQR